MWQCVLGKLEKVVGSAPAAQQTRLTTAQVTEQGPGFVKKPFVSQKQFIQEAWWCLISGWKNKTKQRKYMWTINHPLALGNPVVSECEERKSGITGLVTQNQNCLWKNSHSSPHFGLTLKGHSSGL